MALLSYKYPNDLFNNNSNNNNNNKQMPGGIRILIITRDWDLNSVFYAIAKYLYGIHK